MKGFSKPNWYQIADGRNFHAALVERTSKDEGVPAFHWPVTFLAAAHSTNVLKQMATYRNAHILTVFCENNFV